MKITVEGLQKTNFVTAANCLYNTIYLLRQAQPGGGAEPHLGKSFIKVYSHYGPTMVLLENTSSTWTDNKSMLFEKAPQGTVVKMVQE